jgi:hypothetical protein
VSGLGWLVGIAGFLALVHLAMVATKVRMVRCLRRGEWTKTKPEFQPACDLVTVARMIAAPRDADLDALAEEGRREAVERDPLRHFDGVPWWEAPIPRRVHRCRPQTRGTIGGDSVERCACGAIRQPGWSSWINRNERRQGR